MRRVAIIKDLFRNTPHVVISENNGVVETKGLTEYGNQIIAASQISIDIGQIALPEGFICTGFKTVTPAMEKMLSSTAGSDILVKSLDGSATATAAHSTARILVDRRINTTNLGAKVSADLSINKFLSIDTKMNAIDYKARQFKIASKISALIAPIKSGQFGFDTTKSVFTPRKNNPLSIFAAEIAEKEIPESVMARFLADNGKRGQDNESRRVKRRAVSLSPIVDGQKKLKGNNRISSAIKSRLR